MALGEHSARLTAPSVVDVVFVLDASESAAAHRQEAIALVRDTVALLPARVGVQLFFLGNATSYPPRQLATHATGWFADNARRASLITPVFERLRDEPEAVLVLVSDGRIFDLADWEDSPLHGRAILAQLAEKPCELASLSRELVRPTAHQVSILLNNPLVALRIAGPGFMPVSWDNHGLGVRHDPEWCVTLRGENLPDFSVRLDFFAEDSAEVLATLRHANGTEETWPLKPAGRGTTLDRKENGPLNPKETLAFRAAAQRLPFPCPLCDGEHPWDELLCGHTRTGFSELVYPSLKGVTGFVLLRDTSDAIHFTPQPGEVLRLDAGAVALRERGKATIHRYQGRELGWQPGPRLEPYHRLETDTYALVI